MTTAIVTRQTLTPAIWQMIDAIAPAMHASRLFGVNSKEQAAAIMLKGYELGFSLSASFEFIQVIQGKPTLKPIGHLALILNNPELDGINIDEKPDSCTVTMKRKNGVEYTTTFTLDDAKRAGLVKPDSGWEKYPANMLRWRTIGYCADVVFPDVGAGMKRSDELGADITPEGDVIEGNWRTPQPVLQEFPNQALDDLLNRFDPAQVIRANGGKVPATLEEIEAVVRKLEA
jgi:hypothetical protein